MNNERINDKTIKATSQYSCNESDILIENIYTYIYMQIYIAFTENKNR